MAYIITAPCVGVKDAACVEVCPVDCIYAKDEDDMYYIHPDECIDCGACVPECPVNAIYEEAEVPKEWEHFIRINAEYFTKRTADDGHPSRQRKLRAMRSLRDHSSPGC